MLRVWGAYILEGLIFGILRYLTKNTLYCCIYLVLTNLVLNCCELLFVLNTIFVARSMNCVIIIDNDKVKLYCS